MPIKTLLGINDDISSLLLKQVKYYDSLELEIGISNGAKILQLARKNPAVFYVGIEIKNGTSEAALRNVNKSGLNNIMVIRGEALDIMGSIKIEGILSQVHVYFPSPYPGSVGLENRLVSSLFEKQLYRLLSIGGSFRCVTDHRGYYFEILELFPDVRWQAIDWQELNIDIEDGFFVDTYCERKYKLDGHHIHALQVIKWQ